MIPGAFNCWLVAASRLLGSSVIATDLADREAPHEAAARKPSPMLKRELKGSTVSAPQLVCDWHTKLGVPFDIDGTSGKQRAVCRMLATRRAAPQSRRSCSARRRTAARFRLDRR